MPIKKIFIVEDLPETFKKITKILKRYDFTVSPEGEDFGKNLVKYTECKHESIFEDIFQTVVNFEPEVVILDICWSTSRPGDTSGIKLYDQLVKLQNPPIIWLLTTYGQSIIKIRENDEYIPKKRGGALEKK